MRNIFEPELPFQRTGIQFTEESPTAKGKMRLGIFWEERNQPSQFPR